jgi:hypothetical protein
MQQQQQQHSRKPKIKSGRFCEYTHYSRPLSSSSSSSSLSPLEISIHRPPRWPESGAGEGVAGLDAVSVQMFRTFFFYALWMNKRRMLHCLNDIHP